MLYLTCSSRLSVTHTSEDDVRAPPVPSTAAARIDLDLDSARDDMLKWVLRYRAHLALRSCTADVHSLPHEALRLYRRCSSLEAQVS